MCIGIPLQVVSAEARRAICVDRGGRTERVDTALVGPCAPGEWLLVFLGSARERLDAARAHEVLETLELLQRAAASPAGDDAAVPFELPSAIDAGALAALTGTPRP